MKIVNPEGRTYFHHWETKQSTWKCPKALLGALWVLYHTKDGYSYFQASRTGSSEPPVWKMVRLDDSRCYYFNTVTKETSWTIPKVITEVQSSTCRSASKSAAFADSEWVSFTAPNGKPYFFNRLTGKTQWTKPHSHHTVCTSSSKDKTDTTATQRPAQVSFASKSRASSSLQITSLTVSRLPFPTLRNVLRAALNLQQKPDAVDLRYVNDEGDVITVSSELELNEALRVLTSRDLHAFPRFEVVEAGVPQGAVHILLHER